MNIRMLRLALAVAAAAWAWSGAAVAQPYGFEAAGTVTSAYSADRAFDQVPNPPSSINVGDAFSVKFTLDPVGAVPTDYYAADPTVNIYYWHVTDLVLRAGSQFATFPAAGEQTFATFQLWDNHVVPGLSGVSDSFTLSTLRDLSEGGSPVDLGSGRINAQFHFNAYDDSGTARHSDSLTELPPLTAYGSRSGSFGVLNGDTKLQTVYQVAFSSVSLVPTPPAGAVPEPAAWLSLIIGFGAVGLALRSRRQVVGVV